MIITVEGNIGAGKTSFAKSLYSAMLNTGRKTVYIPEPVEAWTSFQGVNLLDMMYKDRARWAFTFQVNALLHMSRNDKEALQYAEKGYTVIRERSSFSARRVFTPLVSKGLTTHEKHILEVLCNDVEDPVLGRVCACCRASDITIYLRTDPKICYERVIKRGRPEELGDGIDLKYLIELHEMYEQQMPKVQLSGCRLIVANGDEFDINDPISVKIKGGSIKNLLDPENK